MYLGFEIEQFVPLNGYVQVERYVDQVLPTSTKGSAVLDSLYSKFNLTIEYYRRRDSLRV